MHKTDDASALLKC